MTIVMLYILFVNIIYIIEDSSIEKEKALNKIRIVRIVTLSYIFCSITHLSYEDNYSNLIHMRSL